MTLMPGAPGSETSPFGERQPLYQGSTSSLIPEIRGEILLLNEAAANIEDALGFPKKTRENAISLTVEYLDIFRQFTKELSRITKNTSELLPPQLYSDLIEWISPSLGVFSTFGELKNHYQKGLELSAQLQKELYGLGIKDTSREEFGTFPFKIYLTFTLSLSEYSDKDDSIEEDLLPDESFFLDADNEKPYPRASNEVIGFSGNNAFAAMYWTYFTNISQLLASRRYAQAREYFYLFLGDIAILFDQPFLNNCITIEELIFGTDLEQRSLKNTMTVFQLHRSELSALMARAHISPKPDVRQTLNTPLEIPTKIADVIPSPETMR